MSSICPCPWASIRRSARTRHGHRPRNRLTCPGPLMQACSQDPAAHCSRATPTMRPRHRKQDSCQRLPPSPGYMPARCVSATSSPPVPSATCPCAPTAGNAADTGTHGQAPTPARRVGRTTDETTPPRAIGTTHTVIMTTGLPSAATPAMHSRCTGHRAPYTSRAPDAPACDSPGHTAENPPAATMAITFRHQSPRSRRTQSRRSVCLVS